MRRRRRPRFSTRVTRDLETAVRLVLAALGNRGPSTPARQRVRPLCDGAPSCCALSCLSHLLPSVVLKPEAYAIEGYHSGRQRVRPALRAGSASRPPRVGSGWQPTAVLHWTPHAHSPVLRARVVKRLPSRAAPPRHRTCLHTLLVAMPLRQAADAGRVASSARRVGKTSLMNQCVPRAARLPPFREGDRGGQFRTTGLTTPSRPGM